MLDTESVLDTLSLYSYNMFKEFIKYCSENNVFNNYEDAMKAFKIHCKRQKFLEGADPLAKFTENYQKTVRTYFRKEKKHRNYKFYNYNFNDVKAFLKSNHYYGTQVFDCSGTDDMRCIYSKDGVQIFYSGSYDYLEVFGLRPCDFYVLEAAYCRRYTQSL